MERDNVAQQQFEKWTELRDSFELSWRSNASLMLHPLPASNEELKEFAWRVWQHAVSSMRP